MSQEAAPERAVPEQSVPQPGTPAPKGLLQQMEELMAALSADLSQLDADIQSSADRTDQEQPQHRENTPYDSTRHDSTRHGRTPHDGAPSPF
ncbi:hypothetical protein [Streptomyces sp. NPDC056144]|uniref:hypothetical protein n=1 Tax=unclassified Streptomyces TaxID=2593676 RepID=UPI0035E24F32